MKMMNRTYTENDVIVRFENVTKKFGDFTAVNQLNLDIYRGEILGFLGENGAGKSTSMKMLAHLMKPTEGKVLIRGNGHLQVLSTKNKDYLLDKIGFLIENPAFYSNMTPRDLLTYYAKLKGYPKAKIKGRVEEVVELVGMSNWIDKKIKGFSKGMRQKIGIVSALVHDPEIIVFDEPATGLDPTARADVREILFKLKEQGKTIFLSSHLLYEVSEVADRVAIISHGTLLVCDTLDKLESMAQQSVIQMELITPESGVNAQIIAEMEAKIKSHTGVVGSEWHITYNNETEIFEIPFDGTPEHQYTIHQALFAHNYRVIEFSVPKAGLLEDLYIKFINDNEAGIPVEA